MSGRYLWLYNEWNADYTDFFTLTYLHAVIARNEAILLIYTVLLNATKFKVLASLSM